MYCSKCGHRNNSWARSCTSCGEELSERIVLESGEVVEVVQGEDTSLEKASVVKVLVLTLITGGLYAAFWFLRRLNALNSLASPFKLNQGVFGFVIAGCLVNIAIVFYVAFSEGTISPGLAKSLLDTSDVLGLVIQLVVLFQTFKVRRILMDHFNEHLRRDVKFSWILTFLFSIFYLQYKINRL